MRVASRLLLFPTALLLACQLVVSAFGQAWVPPKGEGEMAISYQNLFPSHHYEHFAHSAVGTDLWEVQIGMNVGKRLAPLLPNAFLQMRYSYAMVQRVDGIRPNRSRIETQFGYFLTRRLSVQAIAASQITHSGLDFPEDFPSNSPTDERWRHHDQISTINFLNLG